MKSVTLYSYLLVLLSTAVMQAGLFSHQLSMADQGLLDHISSQLATDNENSNKHICSYCNYKIYSQDLLIKHLSQAHNIQDTRPTVPEIKPEQRIYRCACDKNTDVGSYQDLENHLRKNHKNISSKKFICPAPDCNENCIKLTDMVAHILKKHFNIKAFKCPYCPKSFAKKFSAMEHVKSSCHARPQEATSAANNLGVLQNTENQPHTEEVAPWACMCGVVKQDEKNLKKHILKEHKALQTGEFKCPKCDQVTSGTRDMIRHFVTHTGAKPYECSICHMRFTRRDTAKKHERTCKNNTINMQQQENQNMIPVIHQNAQSQENLGITANASAETSERPTKRQKLGAYAIQFLISSNNI